MTATLTPARAGRFQREVAVLRALDHPALGIVAVLAASLPDEVPTYGESL